MPSAAEHEGGGVMGMGKTMPSSLSQSLRWVQVFLLGLIIIIILLALSDISKLIALLRNVDRVYLSLAVLATYLSYLCITLSYRQLFNLVSCWVRFHELMTVTVSSTLINYFVATGGLSGYALRAVMLKKRNIPVGTTFSVSMLQGVLTNITVIVLFCISMTALVMRENLTGFQLSILIIPIAFASLMILFMLLIIFGEKSSTQVLEIMLKLTATMERWLRRSPGTWVARIQQGSSQVLDILSIFRKQKQNMGLPVILVLFDWVFAMICLYYCFLAINHPLHWTIIASVYFVGIFLSFVFIATGGLGVMEGGMTAVFFEFGVPWETALAAVLIYRLVYYLLPLFAVIPSYLIFARTRSS